MTKFRIKVLGKRWVVRFLKYRAFKKKHTNRVVGITLPYKKRIDLCLRYSDAEIIAHELTHAYLTEMCLRPAEIGVDAMEEIFCDLVGKHAGKIVAQSNDLYRLYKKAK